MKTRFTYKVQALNNLSVVMRRLGQNSNSWLDGFRAKANLTFERTGLSDIIFIAGRTTGNPILASLSRATADGFDGWMVNCIRLPETRRDYLLMARADDLEQRAHLSASSRALNYGYSPAVDYCVMAHQAMGNDIASCVTEERVVDLMFGQIETGLGDVISGQFTASMALAKAGSRVKRLRHLLRNAVNF